ncbi:MAG: hypothetical protein ABJN26_15975 [Stappiaceae bacterium]
MGKEFRKQDHFFRRKDFCFMLWAVVGLIVTVVLLEAIPEPYNQYITYPAVTFYAWHILRRFR